MGQCACAPSKGSRSANINRLLEQDNPMRKDSESSFSGKVKKGKKKNETKLLLLGTGNSGKSTVFKQFQLWHRNGFSEAEREYYKKLMAESTLSTICKLLQNANDLLFEGQMKEDELDTKGLMIMMKNANTGYEASGDDSERVFFTQAIESSPATKPSSTNSSTEGGGLGRSFSSRREQHPSDLSETSHARRTDLSEYGSSLVARSPSFSEGNGTATPEASDNLRSVSKKSSSPISATVSRLSSLGLRPQRSRDKGLTVGATIVSEDVAPLADMVRNLPAGTQLYEKVEVTFHRVSPSGAEQQDKKEMTVAEMLKRIWDDPVIQKVYSMEGKMPSLEAPIAYYMEHIDRISKPNFIPTEVDILFSRKQTRTVQELSFRSEGKNFLLIDVGGQRIERRKWVNYFESVDAVLFVVGLDGYNQLCLEDGKTNRLREALALFKDICDSPFFYNTNFLLFLNKSDLFKEKIQTVPLNVCFRSYTGNQHDYDQCVSYIRKRFVDTHTRLVNKHSQAEMIPPRVYPYVTSATATEQMNYVIATCQSIFLRKGLAQCGIAAM